MERQHIQGQEIMVNYDYNQFLLGLELIAFKMKCDDYRPDYIVGIVRGGAIPAIHLSHMLEIPVQMLHWSTRDVKLVFSESNCWIPEDLQLGKKILIVEDIIDTGASLSAIFSDWESSIYGELPYENIKTAAMWYNQKNKEKIYCDYYHMLHTGEWITFPWEKQ